MYLLVIHNLNWFYEIDFSKQWSCTIHVRSKLKTNKTLKIVRKLL